MTPLSYCPWTSGDVVLEWSRSPHRQLLAPEAELLPERKLRPKDLRLPFYKLHECAFISSVLSLPASVKPCVML